MPRDKKFEPKVEARQEFYRIQRLDDEARLSLGLTSVAAICQHLGVADETYRRWLRGLKKQEKGAFDVKEYLDKNKREIATVLLNRIKGAKSTRDLELALKVMGELVERKEERKFEFSPSDYIRIAREILVGLREQYQESGGICPVCQRPQVFPDEVCVATEPK